MRVAVFGAGYAGLVTGACLAETGNNVICVDTDAEKVEQLRRGTVPIYEPGLEDIVENNIKAGRLTFDTAPEEAVRISEIIFVAVGTPPSPDGSADLSHVLQVAGTIAKHMADYKVIVMKSTVPVGTSQGIREFLDREAAFKDYDVVSNPEFLKEGSAVADFMFPDRIVIGHSTERGKAIMRELYRPYVRTNKPMLFMDNASAELTKYAANSFLATKVSFMNELSNLCERVGADIDDVRIGIGHDQRIGQQFLFPGVGYGGSCFPKDVKALCATSKKHDVSLKVIAAADEVNNRQKRVMVEKIMKYYSDGVRGKTFAVWGLAFKPKTGDMREAPSITIVEELIRVGVKVQAYDPEAGNEAVRCLPKEVRHCDTANGALSGADALVIITEWNEFRSPDFDLIRKELKDRTVFDGRNLFDLEDIKRHKINYISIGRKEVLV
jgi:UDPglucose 6-dehydrogenase